MEPTTAIGLTGAAALGTYAVYRVARREGVRHMVGAASRFAERTMAFSASMTLKVGAVVAGSAAIVASRSGSELLRAARLIDRVAA